MNKSNNYSKTMDFNDDNVINIVEHLKTIFDNSQLGVLLLQVTDNDDKFSIRYSSPKILDLFDGRLLYDTSSCIMSYFKENLPNFLEDCMEVAVSGGYRKFYHAAESGDYFDTYYVDSLDKNIVFVFVESLHFNHEINETSGFIITEVEDQSEKLSLVNTSLIELLGYDDMNDLEKVGVRLRDHLHPDDVDRILNRFKKVSYSSGLFNNVCRMRRKDNLFLWFSFINLISFNTNSMTTKVISFAIDITDVMNDYILSEHNQLVEYLSNMGQTNCSLYGVNLKTGLFTTIISSPYRITNNAMCGNYETILAHYANVVLYHEDSDRFLKDFDKDRFLSQVEEVNGVKCFCGQYRRKTDNGFIWFEAQIIWSMKRKEIVTCFFHDIDKFKKRAIEEEKKLHHYTKFITSLGSMFSMIFSYDVSSELIQILSYNGNVVYDSDNHVGSRYSSFLSTFSAEHVYLEDRAIFLNSCNVDFFLRNSKTSKDFSTLSRRFRYRQDNNSHYSWHELIVVSHKSDEKFFVCLIRDINEIVISEEKQNDILNNVITSENELLEILHSALNEISFDYSVEKDIMYFFSTDSLGRHKKVVINNFLRTIGDSEYIFVDDRSLFESTFLRAMRHPMKSNIEYRASYKDNCFRWYRNVFISLARDGEVYRIIGGINEIPYGKEQLVKSDIEESYSSRYVMVNKINDYLLDPTKKYTFSMFVVDIDELKVLNKKYGYKTGDRVVNALANALKAVFSKQDDIIVRLESDKFCVFSINCTKKKAIDLAKKLHKTLIQPNLVTDVQSISCSIGIASSEDVSFVDFGNIYDYAETAMQNARIDSSDHIGSDGHVAVRNIRNVVNGLLCFNNEAICTSQSKSINELFNILSNIPDVSLSNAVDDVLEAIGVYYNISRIYILKDVKVCGTFEIVNEWCNNDVIPEINKENYFSIDAISKFYKDVDVKDVFYCSDVLRSRIKVECVVKPENVSGVLQCIIRDASAISNIVCFDVFEDNKRLWNHEQIDILRSISFVLSYFVNGHFSHGQLRRSYIENDLKGDASIIIDFFKMMNVGEHITMFFLKSDFKEDNRMFRLLYSSEDNNSRIPQVLTRSYERVKSLNVNSEHDYKQFFDSYWKIAQNGGTLKYFSIDEATSIYSKFVVSQVTQGVICVSIKPVNDPYNPFLSILVSDNQALNISYIGKNLLHWLGVSSFSEYSKKFGYNMRELMHYDFNTLNFDENGTFIDSGAILFKIKKSNKEFLWVIAKKLLDNTVFKKNEIVFQCFNVDSTINSLMRENIAFQQQSDVLSSPYTAIFLIDAQDKSFISLWRKEDDILYIKQKRGFVSDIVDTLVSSGLHPDDKELFSNYFDIDNFIAETPTSDGIKSHSIQWRRLCSNGQKYNWFESNLIWSEKSPSVVSFTLMNIDEKKRKELGLLATIERNKEYELDLLSQITSENEGIDPISGLMNATTFNLSVSSLLLNSDDSDNFFVVDFDIISFESLNAIYGFERGDEVLKIIGDAVLQSLTIGGIACRKYADKFLLFLKDENVDKLFQRLNFISSHVSGLTSEYSVVISFGVYAVVDRMMSFRQMCDNARLAKLSVKGNYKETVAIFDETMAYRKIEENKVNASMNAALKNGEFKVWYQPQFNPVSEKIVGVEALARWIKPDGTIIQPGGFIPYFEKSRLVTSLDWYIFEEVCIFISKRLNAKLPCPTVAVNFSRSHSFDMSFIHSLVHVSSLYNVPHNLLSIEITESAVLEKFDEIKYFSEKLHEFGFGMAIDDFGNGYTVLNMLTEMTFDVLKLDKQMLNNHEKYRQRLLISSVITLAKKMGLIVIAEGVEEEVQVQLYRDLKCDVIQGFYYSKPISEEALTLILDNKFK